GNTLAPKLADHYLARTNIKGQQTDEEISADRRDYLFEPVAEDRGADGPFSAEAKSRCWQLKATKHRRGDLVRARIAWGGACASMRPVICGGRTPSSTASMSRPFSTPTATASATCEA